MTAISSSTVHQKDFKPKRAQSQDWATLWPHPVQPLPAELWLEILGKLNLHELPKLRRVCQQWNRCSSTLLNPALCLIAKAHGIQLPENIPVSGSLSTSLQAQNQGTNHHQKAFFTAVKAGNLATAQAFLELFPELLNSHDNYGQWPPLLRAIDAKQVAMVRFLLAKGADASTFSGSKEGALKLAAQTDLPELIHLLMEAHPELPIDDKRHRHQRTPLWFAVSVGCAKTAATLLKLGACPHLPDIDGTTPYQIAKERHPKIRALFDEYLASPAL